MYITILYLLLLYTAILLNLFKCVIIIYITIYVIFVTAILRYLILYITIFLLLLYYWYYYSKVLSITTTKNQHISTLWCYYYILELWYYYYLLKTMTKKQWLPELCPELVELNATVRMRFAKFREVHQLQICYCAILNYYLW